MFPCWALRHFPRCAVRRSLPSVAIPLVLLAFSLPSARCQLNSRSPFTARVASVTLVATLETLSVGAAPAASPAAVLSGGMAATSRVAITTRWVVPSHLTTLRLVGYIQPSPLATAGNGGPQSAIPASANQPQQTDAFPAALSGNGGNGPEQIPVGLPMVTQEANSNSPGTRIDELNPAAARSQASSLPGMVSILVQAL